MTDTAARTCACCTRALRAHEHGRHACRPCETRMRGWLAELPTQLIVLRGSLAPERGTGQYVTRTRTAPIPARLDALSLDGPSAPGDVHDPHGDQNGPLPIAATLGSWVRLVAEERHLHGSAGRPSAEQLAAWLEPHLDWCAAQQWVAELHAELDSMMRAVRGITRTQPGRRPVRGVPCPRCDSLTVTEVDHQLYRECATCGSLFTPDELALDAVARMARQAAA